MASAAIMVSKPSRRLRKQRVDEATRIARLLLPAAQADRGSFKVVDVQNHSEADQRRMVRSGEKRTIKRRSHIERLAHVLELDEREAAACEWYASVHAARYDTLNVTAGYGDGGRSSRTNYDHLPANSEQESAAEQFDWATRAICPSIRLMFDRIVIHGWPVEKAPETLFRMALNQLVYRIEGFVAL